MLLPKVLDVLKTLVGLGQGHLWSVPGMELAPNFHAAVPLHVLDDPGGLCVFDPTIKVSPKEDALLGLGIS